MFRRPYGISPKEGTWDEQKSKLKQQFSTLTDQDLYFERGNIQEMITSLQHKLGKSKEEMNDIIAAL